ncbi:hypothetical protein LWF15_31995 [Kineosporia rhizophila]|uniref:hypothetical protein n=1 Tax=Kineosporia TaxID=49184 RepID=UPI000AA51988|nr:MULTISPECIES: hypothetical protein [Kineosporia]MCE0540125.1 hypothetical protein [Kineosporia rhizophila]GLY13333.1 hypothetical protein Kisp01_03490 [Kineosporia sp. NBRC 101677]
MDYVAAIFPSIGVLFLFVIAIRAVFQADRRERLAQAAEDRRAAAAEKAAGQTHTAQSTGQSAGPGESPKPAGTPGQQ